MVGGYAVDPHSTVVYSQAVILLSPSGKGLQSIGSRLPSSSLNNSSCKLGMYL